jgi:uncharacterized protein (TIGR02118 family)
MIRVNILYPNHEGSRFDPEYYFNTHMPMSIQKLGTALRGVSVEHGLSGTEPGSPPVYIAMCHLRFDSIEAFLEAFVPHAELLQGDIAKYTDIEPIIQFSEERIFNSSSQ